MFTLAEVGELCQKARLDALEEAAQKAEKIIATEGPWSNIPAAIRALGEKE